MRAAPREGWILAGTVDGVEARPALIEPVAGAPYLLRLACEMALSGVARITLVWKTDRPLPDLDAIVRDPRLASRAILITGDPPDGCDDDAIMITRADRVFHRDVPRQAIAAWCASDAQIARVAGDEHDAVVVTSRGIARRLADAAARPGGLATELSQHTVATEEPPYLGFTTPAPDARALRRAERRLVWSLRKSSDGIASRLLNRHLSLPMTWLLRKTAIHPNHVTLIAFACAVAGAIVLARGGYAAGVAGMLLVELGSIIDGVDGELARLRFQFSRLGQWLDTVADDAGNLCYATGLAIHLHLAGVAWAVPLAATALLAFISTQAMQYYLLVRVYRSGDLAAIPWAYQGTEFLSARPDGVVAWVRSTIPKMFKRDFILTAFVALALLGRLDLVLVVFSGGALVFFCTFWVQYLRHRKTMYLAFTPTSVARPTVVHAGD